MCDITRVVYAFVVMRIMSEVIWRIDEYAEMHLRIHGIKYSLTLFIITL